MKFEPKKVLAQLTQDALAFYGGEQLRVHAMYAGALDDAGEIMGQDPSLLSDESARVVAGAFALRLYVEKNSPSQTT